MVTGPGRKAPSRVMLSGLSFAVIAAVMMGFYVPHFDTMHSVPILDLQGMRSSADTLELMARYTPAARQAYLVFLGLDCLFPVLGSWFVIEVVRAALASFGREQSHLRMGLFFPVAAAAADLVENCFHGLLALTYPSRAELWAQAATLSTGLKFLFLIGNYGVFAAAIVALVAKQVARVRS